MKRNRFFLAAIFIAIFHCVYSQSKKSQYQISSFPGFNASFSSNKPLGPDWIHAAAFYEIYPQSFKDTNGDGIGDLKGIISKLDYVKSLGVDAIWLNPFYVSPFRDAGYDVSDYYHVDKRYGSDQDAKDLFRIAKEKGLRVIIDFVPGHTSIDHPWFKASCSTTPNKYSNWYIWTNGTWFNDDYKFKENFIQGYCERDGNFMTNFFWHQPALNYGFGNPDPNQPWQLAVNHPDVMALRTEMKNIMRHWLNMGCSGFRVDMAGSLVKNDPNGNIKYFWQDVRQMIDSEYPDAFLISEWSLPTAAVKAGFHADFMHWFEGYPDLFSLPNSFFRSKGEGNICNFLYNYMKQYEETKNNGYISLPVGNHDVMRVCNLSRDQRDLEIIQVFAFTMPNIPFIYYGDEIGMSQLDIKTGKEGAYGTRAGARTPMQWDGGLNHGFSEANSSQLYLPMDTISSAPSVSKEQTNPKSLLTFVRKLVQIHKTESALSNYAAFIPVYAVENRYPFVFLRIQGDSKILVVLNPSNQFTEATINGTISGKRRLLLGTMPKWTIHNDQTTLIVEPKSFAIVKIRSN
ncbi:MAG: alpha-amylase family glycosyl hydrolase [Bacteroidales bacterium]|nr:alpha-amylase family glycosyl hydrolase [Bacteroidales bacterium]